MVNVLTDWRDAMIAALVVAFPDAEVKPGARAGVSRDRDRIAVFAGPWVTAENVVVAKPQLVIRYWKRRSKQLSPTEPADPTELEQAKVDLLDVLRANQKLDTLERPWFYILDTAHIDEDPSEWGVEAVLTGFTANTAVIP